MHHSWRVGWGIDCARTGDSQALVESMAGPCLTTNYPKWSQAGAREVVLLTEIWRRQDRRILRVTVSKVGAFNTLCAEHVTPGTAGAVLQALDSLEHRFLVLYGDTVLDSTWPA